MLVLLATTNTKMNMRTEPFAVSMQKRHYDAFSNWSTYSFLLGVDNPWKLRRANVNLQ